ncbi:MAG: hypothetical protein KDJ14_01440 [Xanthomonadales bacterium]|nr:hypothetical protein [Xanthomonadales bacterium]
MNEGTVAPTTWGEPMQLGDARDQTVAVVQTLHRGDDDLLTGGLGRAGLLADIQAAATSTDRAALRRRAIHTNWRGIAALGRRDVVNAALDVPVPGREFHAALQWPGDRQPSRFMLQLPDHFDVRRPRLLVVPSSGSRGIYGAMALGSGWALPRGWAVAYTDRGAGTDWFDVDTRTAPELSGLRTDDPAAQLFRVDSAELAGLPKHSVLIKHAHGGDHAEAHWGAFVEQARDFAWRLIDRVLPDCIGPRVSVAAGLSNGGGAVLRVLELEHGFDGVLAAAPNVYPVGGRAFPRYALEAALWIALAQAAPTLRDAPSPLPAEAWQAQAEQAESALLELGLLRRRSANNPVFAYRHLRRRGWPSETLAATRLSSVFDFWFSALPTYFCAAGRFAPNAQPLPVWFGPAAADGAPRAATDAERNLWWSDAAGIVPGAGVSLHTPDGRTAVLRRASELVRGNDDIAQRVRQGFRATRCGPILRSCPTTVLHGRSDGLIPSVCSSEPWLRFARAQGHRDVESIRPERTPHFDAFLGLPGYGEHYDAMLPHVYAGLDALAARLRS